MTFPGKLRVWAVGCALVGGLIGATAADDPLAWPAITAEQKPWAFNWWMGSAVDKTNLTRELERYAAAGLGGIHIIPIYGAKGFEDKYINYLSPQWLEMMGYAVSEAKRLGMGVDMTTGTGWCFGGPQITDNDANASVVVKTYELGVGERIPDKFKPGSVQAAVAYWHDGKTLDLTGSLGAEGTLNFTPPGNAVGSGTNTQAPKVATVYVISQKPSGQKVKRPAPGGEGWMLNLIYPGAMDDFLKPYTAAFAQYTGPKPRAQYHDSYEYKSDWSPVFFAEFEKRRSYHLQNELPALFGGKTDDHAARVLCDYRQTVSEIMAEESLPKWVKWSHDHGFITRDQAHGSPGNWLDLYATADIPETEMFHSDRNKLISKFASSAAHVTGKPLVSSETGTWLEEHFTEKLSDVKYLFDDMFLSGINHMFYHGCCYSPDEAGWPGWHFYASLEMNPRNAIWHDALAVNTYAARCQSLLQAGQPDNDVLIYWDIADFWMQPGDKLLPQLTVHARDWFEGEPIGKTAKQLWDSGYSFDYISDAQLKVAQVAADGRVKLPGGSYGQIVVPGCHYIPLETFQQLLKLADQGAHVLFQDQLPADVSGNARLATKRETLADLLKELSNKPRVGSTYVVGKGTVGVTNLTEGLQATREPMVEVGLSYVRRTIEGGWVYFIANRGETNIDTWVKLGCGAKSGVIMDPMNGATGLAALQAGTNGQPSQVHLQLRAGESVLLRAYQSRHVTGPAWTYRQPPCTPVVLTGTWQVDFVEGGPVLPAPAQLTQLTSWTTLSDTNCQAFAGTARYQLHFSTPDLAGQTVELSLGRVAQSARVRLNGKDYGTLLLPPYTVTVDNLKATENLLEVDVTSVSANRIRDLDQRGVKWKTFRDINIVDINYKPFDASNWPLTDCGLLGPVTVAK